MRTIHSSRIWRLRCLRSRVAYAIAWSSASRAGVTRRDFVPLRPSASCMRRLWRLWDVTPRLTRAMRFDPLLEVRQQATDLLRVLGPDDRFASVTARAAGRLDLEVVPGPGLDAHELTAAGYADALLGRLVALDLGHPASLSSRDRL